MTKREKVFEFIKENKRLLAVLGLFAIAGIFILSLTYVNWMVYLPWNRAKAVKAAEDYLAQSYNGTFEIKTVESSMQAPNAYDDFYTSGVFTMAVCDENGLEARICVDRKFCVIMDNYMKVCADDMLNKYIAEKTESLGLKTVEKAEFIYYGYGYGIDNALKPLATFDEVNNEFIKIYSRYDYDCIIDLRKIDETTADDVFEAVKAIRDMGFDNVYENLYVRYDYSQKVYSAYQKYQNDTQLLDLIRTAVSKL